MTAHPLPGDTMEETEPIQLSPQILILLTLPAEGHGLDQQLRIGMEHDGLSGRDDFQGFDRSHHFHAVVRGLHTMARSLHSLLAALNDISPAAGTGVPETTPVSEDLNLSDGTHRGRNLLMRLKHRSTLDTFPAGAGQSAGAV